MRQQRSVAVLVMGILNTVFGSFWFLIGICAGLNFLLVPLATSLTKGQIDPIADMKKIPGYLAFEIGTMVCDLLFALLLILSGIGMLFVKPWARRLALAVGAVLILREILGVLFQILYLNPAIAEMMKKQFQQLNMPPVFTMFNNPAWLNAAAILKAFLPAAYAVTLLVIMLLPAVRAAFRPRGIQEHTADDDRTIIEDQALDDRQEGNP
ncbi:MAG TPA: hypothetical protein VGY58_19345 [Gemmataceae bacterium]|jgi:hypothetical protein|nr:hypothetical protein [Gemmataceae bacterium]